MKKGWGVLCACVIAGCAATDDTVIYRENDKAGIQSEPRPETTALSGSRGDSAWDRLKTRKSPFAITKNRDSTLYLRADRDLDQVFMLRVAAEGRDQVELAIPVGREPVSVVLNNAETRAYVSNLGDGTISVLDVTPHDTATVVGSVRIASNLFCLIFSRTGEFLYAVSRYGDKVWVVDPDANQVVGTTSIRQLDLSVRRECYSGCHAQDPQRRRVLDRLSGDIVATIE
jgi:DNA-binding beta-propeller fold protein YncE